MSASQYSLFHILRDREHVWTGKWKLRKKLNWYGVEINLRDATAKEISFEEENIVLRRNIVVVVAAAPVVVVEAAALITLVVAVVVVVVRLQKWL